MKTIKSNRIFQIIYPILVYFIIYNISISIFKDFLLDRFGALFCIFLASLITLIPIFIIYIKVPKIVPDHIINKDYILRILGLFCLTIVIAISLNIFISHVDLIIKSAGFSHAQSNLTDGSLVIKILCNCISIPILEEMLYRGIIIGQLSYMTNNKVAIIISAICFGILHFNIVQFLYAFLVGLMLGITYTYSKRLWIVILAHGLINFIVIIFS